MSRSHTVLVAALVGVAGLAGIVQLSQPGPGDAEAAAPVDPIAPVASAPRAAASIAAPVSDPPFVGPGRRVDDPSASNGVTGAIGAVATETTAVVEPNCTLSIRLALGDTDPQVACLEAWLIEAGALSGVTPDESFQADTQRAVRRFQEANGLVVDGVVGPQTAEQLGVWTGPAVLPPDPATCPDTGHAAVVDRFNQRAWLCGDGEITQVMPMTSAITQPDPGTYTVYAKDLDASSTLTGKYSTMTHFVAFAYGKYQGARVAFHSVPKYSDGEYIQPLDSVGTQELFGASSGCIRLLPDDAVDVWDWLDVGDEVVVVT
jgi:peptidoglycan hydrolase-like protein with peptidoglycan-binding domain